MPTESEQPTTVMDPPAPPGSEEVQEHEVTFVPDDVEFDQNPKQAKSETEDDDGDILDKIVPKADPKTWVIGPPDMQRTYIQKPLSFIAKMQWFSLVGEALDKALSGENGLSLNNLFSAPQGARGAIRAEDLRDADTFVQAISKLLSAAPDFLVKSYAIWLNVPDYERDIILDLMKLPEDEGGLSDEQGIEIIEVFLDQNYDSLASFFGDRLGQLQARVQKLNEDRASRRSKR